MATEPALAEALTHDAELTVEQAAIADAEALSARQKVPDVDAGCHRAGAALAGGYQ